MIQNIQPESELATSNQLIHFAKGKQHKFFQFNKFNFNFKEFPITRSLVEHTFFLQYYHNYYILLLWIHKIK